MNNRIMGIIGSALLILGVFMPFVSFMGGFASFSYFDLIRIDPARMFTGIVILLLGLASLFLALKNRYKQLILTGVLSLCLLALDFFRMRSGLSGSSAGADDISSQIEASISIGWGFYLMAIAAIILILAGVMKSKVPAGNAGWNPPPPPYPPAGR